MGEIALIVSAAIQAIATVVLVGVTIYYALQTKRSVDAMERSSKAEFLPILMLGVYPKRCSETVLAISLQNEGRGLAKRPVKVTFPGVAPIFVNSLSPKEDQDVTITYDIAYVLSLPETERKITVQYEDVFGRSVCSEALLVECNNYGPESSSRGLKWEAWHCVLP